jgi:hypothetical protein
MVDPAFAVFSQWLVFVVSSRLLIVIVSPLPVVVEVEVVVSFAHAETASLATAAVGGVVRISGTSACGRLYWVCVV